MPASGSQFRSRDLFPQAAAAIALGQPDALTDEILLEGIPDTPPNRIAYIDGYGNLKTTILQGATSALTGTQVQVRISGVERDAVVSDGTFDVEAGQLAFAPGSSGWSNTNREMTRWMEIFLRGGNAWEMFGRPSIGDAVEIALKS